MTFRVTLASDPDVSFEVDSHQSILQAASCAGIDIPSCCENGVCGTCKGRIVKGEIDYSDIEPVGLLPDEADAGEALFCCAHADSDLVIDHDEMLLPGESAPRFFKAELGEVNAIHKDTYAVTLNLQTPRAFASLPGQYIELIIGTKRHALTIVAVDHATITLEIMAPEDRPDSIELMAQIEEAEKLMVYGPIGRGYWREKRSEPVLMLAGGSGITPMIPMLKLALQDKERPIHLYWGARHSNQLYHLELFKAWQESNSNFHFHPVVSEEPDTDHRKGLAFEAAMTDFDDLSSYILYMAGPVDMVKVAYEAFSSKGLKRNNAYCDFFKFLNL